MTIDQRLSVVPSEGCGVDRRGFLGRCAGCALASGCVVGAWGAAGPGQAGLRGGEDPRAAGLQPHPPGPADLALHQL